MPEIENIKVVLENPVDHFVRETGKGPVLVHPCDSGSTAGGGALILFGVAVIFFEYP